MLPGSPEWDRAHAAYLSPPEYDGCEDCECEDPEVADTTYECGDGCCREVCECKCHDLPPEPEGDDDGRTPYHLMPGYGEDY